MSFTSVREIVKKTAVPLLLSSERLSIAMTINRYSMMVSKSKDIATVMLPEVLLMLKCSASTPERE